MSDRIDRLLNKLVELDIQVELDDKNNLAILKNISEIPADLLNELKEQKSALIAYFQNKKTESKDQKYNRIPKAEQKDFYALSSAQKRLYFLQSLSPDSTSYNMSYYHVFNDSLDVERLESSLQKLITRHEILRTCFVEENGAVVQKILGHIDFHTEFYECGSPADIDQLIKGSVYAFDLAKGPLLRSRLIKIKDKYLWILDIHHIISDGTSQEILVEDMLAIYQGIELPALPLVYKDYSEWQNKLNENGTLANQQTYWQKKLSGELPVLNLPLDYSRPAVFTFQGERFSFRINKKQTAQLKDLGERHKGTLQMSLMTVLKVLLFKYTGQEDSVLGCGISGRAHNELQRLVGMFVNMLAIRSQPMNTKSFSAFYKEVIAASLEAYDNQDVQFDELVDLLKINRDVSRNPVFDITLVVQNFERSELNQEAEMLAALSQNSSLEVELKHATSKFDLTFFVHELGPEIEIVMEYYTGIFKESTIQRIASHFNELLTQILANDAILISNLDLLSEQEKEKVQKEFNATTREYPHTSIHSLFSKQSYLNPGKAAVSDVYGSYMYSEIEKRSNRLADFLTKGLTLPVEACVAILQLRNKEIVPSLLGILKSGGAFLNLDADLPEERLLYMLQDANVNYLLTEKKLMGLASRLQWRSGVKHLICIDSENIYSEHGGLTSELMRKDLWDYVGDTAVDAITAGGWLSSYTGNAISKDEMQEYSDNAFLKLKDLLHKDMRVLEIGCSSGLTMFKIAPHVKSYYGTDLSSGILNHTEKFAKENGYDNVFLKCMPAQEIENLGEKEFDLIVINSVIQCFEDHNYLKDILYKSLGLLKDQGCIFAGDIMDEEKRMTLIHELEAFKQNDIKHEFKTKTDFSSELFVSKDFFRDLVAENSGITHVSFSEKIHTIENELTKFRYDALLHVNKNDKTKTKERSRYQHDLRTIQQYSDMASAATIKGNNLAYIIYTSGSTGKPKGVMIEHQAIVNTLLAQIDFFGIDRNNRGLQFASFSFDASVSEIFIMLLAGAHLAIINEQDRKDPELVTDFIKACEIDIATIPPSYLNKMTISELKRLKTLITAGEPASYEKALAYLPFGTYFNAYGPTETSICCTMFKLKNKEMLSAATIPIGKPISNASVYIVNPENQVVPVGVTGEICVGGAGLARGYLNQEELTKEKFIKNPFKDGERLYKTGDLGRWLEDGNIEFIGRKDEQVKIRGYRIEPGELEQVLLKHKQINEAVVIAKTNNLDEKELVAYITSPQQQNAVDLRSYLKEHLPEYMLPAHYVQLEKLPLTNNGKINKKALPDLQGLGLTGGTEYLAPRNEVEEKLVKIWEAVLKKETIGIRDDFFALGGHSLKAITILKIIHSEFSVQIRIKEIFENTTIESLGEIIKHELWINTRSGEKILTDTNDNSFVL